MEPAAAPEVERIPADFMHDPFELFARLRREGPARRVVMPHGAAVWFVSRYDDVRALLTDPRISKDGRRANELFERHSGSAAEPAAGSAGGRFDDVLAAHLLNTDPPRHTRLRTLVSKAFTAHRMAALGPLIEREVDDLLDAVAGLPEVDLIEAFAGPLPLTIVLDLMGVPQHDRDDFRRWSVPLVGGGDHDPAAVLEASRQLVRYANALIEAKRADPDGTLISALVRVSDEGDRLSTDEIVAMIFLFVVAGSDTPMNQLGNAVYDLLTHPEELARLRADLTLMPAAVDELLRFNSSVATASFRFTLEDVPVGDAVIPAGELVLLSFSAANRDGARFPDPDRLDLCRHPAGALAFGHGIHYCIGAPLARLTMITALTRLLRRYPRLRLACEPERVRWRGSTLVRGPEALPVRLS